MRDWTCYNCALLREMIMNERIKELVKQAGFSFKYKTAPDELNPGHNLQDLEKFAELIVRECADVCFRIDGEYDGEEVLATWCGDGILKHFGVEE